MIKTLDIIFDKQVPSVEVTCSLVADTKEEVNFEVTDAEHLIIGLGTGTKLSFGSTVLTCDGHFGILGSEGWVFDGEEPGPEPPAPKEDRIFNVNNVEIPEGETRFYVDTSIEQNGISLVNRGQVDWAMPRISYTDPVQIEDLEFTKKIYIPETGFFSFEVESDDKYKLSIAGELPSYGRETLTIIKDDTTIVDTINMSNLGMHKSDVELTAGTYKLKLGEYASGYIYAVILEAV